MLVAVVVAVVVVAVVAAVVAVGVTGLKASWLTSLLAGSFLMPAHFRTKSCAVANNNSNNNKVSLSDFWLCGNILVVFAVYRTSFDASATSYLQIVLAEGPLNHADHGPKHRTKQKKKTTAAMTNYYHFATNPVLNGENLPG